MSATTSTVCTNCGAPSHSTANCRIPKRMIERWYREGTGPPFFKKFADENPALFTSMGSGSTSSSTVSLGSIDSDSRQRRWTLGGEGNNPLSSVPDIAQKAKEAQIQKEKQFLEEERKKVGERHQSFHESINDPTKDFRTLLKRTGTNSSQQSSKEGLPLPSNGSSMSIPKVTNTDSSPLNAPSSVSMPPSAFSRTNTNTSTASTPVVNYSQPSSLPAMKPVSSLPAMKPVEKKTEPTSNGEKVSSKQTETKKDKKVDSIKEETTERPMSPTKKSKEKEREREEEKPKQPKEKEEKSRKSTKSPTPQEVTKTTSAEIIPNLGLNSQQNEDLKHMTDEINSLAQGIFYIIGTSQSQATEVSSLREQLNEIRKAIESVVQKDMAETTIKKKEKSAKAYHSDEDQTEKKSTGKPRTKSALVLESPLKKTTKKKVEDDFDDSHSTSSKSSKKAPKEIKEKETKEKEKEKEKEVASTKSKTQTSTPTKSKDSETKEKTSTPLKAAFSGLFKSRDRSSTIA